MNNEIIVGAVFFVLGLIPAYLFYLKSIRIKEPVYFIKNERIIYSYQSTVPNLKITYKKKTIEDLSISTVLFYNRGAETITQQDIDTVNHLRIVANNDVKILDVTIEKYNNPASNFNVILNNNQAIINFDYINKNQGVVIFVTHTGKSNEDIKLVGDIKGVDKLSNVSKRTTYQEFLIRFTNKMNDRRFVQNVVTPIFVLILVAIMVLVIFKIYYPDYFRNLNDESPAFSDVVVFFALGFSVILLILFISITRIMFNQNNIIPPKGLEY